MDEQEFIYPGETITEINHDLRLIQKPDGLTFGTDALLLAAFVRPKRGACALDFGSGTGVISLLCALRKGFSSIYALEIQPDYADLIGRNAALNGLSQIIRPVCGDVREFRQEADTVFSNPPYMKVGSGLSSRDDGRDMARRERNGDIGDFCRGAAACLKYGGAFYVVYRPDRLVDLLCAMRESKIEPKRMVLVADDSRHAPGIVLVEGRRGGSPSLILPKTLYLRKDDGSPSEEMAHILAHGEWYE